MELEVLQAAKGDCLLIHSEEAGEPRLILIDGGPKGVWENSLQPRLQELRAERGLGADEPLVIDLLIVSHVDDDHINGIIKLLQSMKSRKDAALPAEFRIDRLWHNSFDDILGNDDLSVLGRASRFGAASTDHDREAAVANLEPGPAWDAGYVLASIRQGDDLRRLAKALDIPLNPEFNEGLICVPEDEGLTVKACGVAFTILGPHHDELAALQAKHDEWLARNPARQADGAALLAALDDKSVANLSSLVLWAEGDGKTVLLTGDARSDHILSGLEKAGLVSGPDPIAVDILKMPHHGSIRNLDDAGDFLRRVTSTNYVFSGNGEHGNPDRETFELLFATRPGATVNLYLTYSLDKIDTVRKAVYDRARDRKAPDKRPRPWSDADDSLAAILTPPPPGTRVVAHEGAPLRL